MAHSHTSFDRDPASIPDDSVDTGEPRFAFSGVEPGVWYAHVRACDGAGNWGPPGHARIEIAAPED